MAKHIFQCKKIIYVRLDQENKLKQEQKKTGASIAEIVRRAIDYYLPKKKGD